MVMGCSILCAAGCQSVLNGWLDPSVVGEFKHTAIKDIRTSLTLEDLPAGIPGATYPRGEDFELIVREYPISAGDTLDIEINELRQRQMPYRTQIQVAPAGYINLPVVGRVQAAGLTPPEFQEHLKDALRQRTVLVDPEVTVNPLFLGKATYSIFGIGVSAANNAPLRAGTFPIRKPDLRLLEAINQVGGLNEFVTEVYVFRQEGEPPPAAFVPKDNGDIYKPAPPQQLEEPSPEEPDEPIREPRDRDIAPNAEQELFELIEGKEEPPPEPPPAEPKQLEIPPELEPDIVDPYIYVDGEFVPNPAYSGRREKAVAPPQAAMQTITPGVNWARIAGDTMYRIIVVPAEPLRAGDLSVNMFVRPEDVIRIVSGEIGVYYVMGQVNRIGPFAFNAEQVTLKAAIAAAGGLSGLAWPSRCTVYRRLGVAEQMIQVDLDRIFAGLDPDFLVKRGDIINVGTHPFAPFLQRIRALTLPNPVANVGYGFTYTRNFADIDSFAVRQNPHNEPDRFPALFP